MSKCIDSTPMIDPELLQAAVMYGAPDINEPEYIDYPDEMTIHPEFARGMIQKYYCSPETLAHYTEVLDLERITIDNMFDGSKLDLLIVKSKNAKEGPHPFFYSIHGGGFYSGTPEMDLDKMAPLCLQHDFICISPYYRLTPENHHPELLYDVYSGIKWSIDHAEELGIDTQKVAVGGESAGATLSASLCLLARDRKEFTIHHLRLCSPALDDRGCRQPRHPYNGQYAFTRRANYFMWKWLLNGINPGSDEVDADSYYVPARATSLAGLPRTYLCVGSLELFADETLQFASKLMRDGVVCELHLYPGWHHNAIAVPSAYHVKREVENRNHALLKDLGLI